MKQALTEHVSVQEMREMRANGMTNQDIANSLNVSYQTIYKYLGPQPSRGGRVASTLPMEIAKPKEPEPESEKPAVLLVVNRVLNLAGKKASYTIDAHKKLVEIEFDNGGRGEIPYGDWEIFADEVDAIRRNLKGQTVPPEMW